LGGEVVEKLQVLALRRADVAWIPSVGKQVGNENRTEKTRALRMGCLDEIKELRRLDIELH